VRPGLAPYEHDEGSVDEAHGGVGLAGNDGDAYRLFLEVFARGHDDGEEKTLSVRAGGRVGLKNLRVLQQPFQLLVVLTRGQGDDTANEQWQRQHQQPAAATQQQRLAATTASDNNSDQQQQ
jgi:hypothetical protein